MKSRLNLYQHFTNLVNASRLTFPMIVAAFVGVGTGFLAVGFIKIIGLVQEFSFGTVAGSFSFLGQYAIILIPVLGGLLVGPIVTFFAPEAKGHGVPEVLKAIAIHGGRIRPIVVIAKVIASAIAIGTGASVGREGPIVQVGSALGSTTGQAMKSGEARTKNLIACGAAAGIASVFNAPIAGVLFASEVILRDFGARALSTVVVAAVSASVVSRIFLGESPAFTIPSYSLISAWELLLYLGLGVLAALTSQLFTWFLYKNEDFFDKWKFPAWLKPAVGGLLIGIIGVYFPHVMGAGLETIGKVLQGDFTLKLLFCLVFVKIAATSFSLGSGSSGGVFAPALFIGAVLGGVIGKLAFNHMPFPVEAPGAYAVAGMASVFAAAAHAPVTAILIVFEMTRDYRMILPIMVTVITATSLSQFISRQSIYTFKLKEEGIDVASFEDAKALGALQVRDAMEIHYELIPNDLQARKVIEKMIKHKHKSFFVVDQEGDPIGFIRPEEVQETLLDEDLRMINATDIMSPLIHYCFPEEPLNEVSRLMLNYNLPFVPVVDPSDPRRVVGLLKPENVFKAYIHLSQKRSDFVDRTEQGFSRIGGMVSAHFIVPVEFSVSGKLIKDLQIPQGVILASIKRKGTVVSPQGDTLLKPSDEVWTIFNPNMEQVFKEWLEKNKLILVQ